MWVCVCVCVCVCVGAAATATVLPHLVQPVQPAQPAQLVLPLAVLPVCCHRCVLLPPVCAADTGVCCRTCVNAAAWSAAGGALLPVLAMPNVFIHTFCAESCTFRHK